MYFLSYITQIFLKNFKISVLHFKGISYIFIKYKCIKILYFKTQYICNFYNLEKIICNKSFISKITTGYLFSSPSMSDSDLEINCTDLNNFNNLINIPVLYTVH